MIDLKIKVYYREIKVLFLNIKTSSNQRLGECVRSEMDSQSVAKEQDCRHTMLLNMPQMERRGISSCNVLEDRLHDEPKEHLCAK